MVTNEELYHHGIQGQKWGQRNGPPYPLSKSAHSSREKKKQWWKSLLGGDSQSKSDKKNKPKKKVEVKNQNEEKTEEEKKAEYESAKQKALKSGKASDIMQFKGDLTNQELQNALMRLDLEARMSSLAAKDFKTTEDKIDMAINKIEKVAGWAEKGSRAYNIGAKIYNAFSGEDKLPIIGEKNSDRKLKLLLNENQKLKNENQSLLNKGEKLKNEQIEMIINNQKKADKARKKQEQQNNKPKTETEQIVKDHKNATADLNKSVEKLREIADKTDKKKKKKKG